MTIEWSLVSRHFYQQTMDAPNLLLQDLRRRIHYNVYFSLSAQSFIIVTKNVPQDRHSYNYQNVLRACTQLSWEIKRTFLQVKGRKI